MCIQCLKFLPRVQGYVQADLLFPHSGFDWVPLFPSPVMIGMLAIASACAVCIALGVLFRVAGLILALVMGYLLFIDQLYFNNHYYLFFLLAILLTCTSAHRVLHIRDLWRRRLPVVKVPRWQYLILQLQVAIVFFYGGIAKLNADWFSGAVARPLAADHFGDGRWAEIVSAFLTWGGAGFDLAIPFLLFYRKTRAIAILLVVVFNLSNHFLFRDIALFPWVMTAAVIFLFGSDTFIEKKIFLGLKKGGFKFLKAKVGAKEPSRILIYGLGLYFIFQFTFPLRHMLHEGCPEWTGQGHYFAWRMKSFTKQVDVTFNAYDSVTGQKLYPIKSGFDINAAQRICAFPQMVQRVAMTFQERLNALGDSTHKVRVDYRVSLNGHPKMPAIDPNVNLEGVRFHAWRHNAWILQWRPGE